MLEPVKDDLPVGTENASASVEPIKSADHDQRLARRANVGKAYKTVLIRARKEDLEGPPAYPYPLQRERVERCAADLGPCVASPDVT